MAIAIKKTGGTWDRTHWPVYFVAADVGTLDSGFACSTHMLAAVNQLNSARDLSTVIKFMDAGRSVLIDSGVYELSTRHAEAHGLSMNEALALAPARVDGFNDLYSRYCTLMQQLGDRAWGYIEIDQGGMDNKIKTRARLEAAGLRPIPVYHPINDGWDYFDFLAKRYDRICFGNVVMADIGARKRLIATAWERRRKYPHLWIHALGMTPSETTTAFPINSCDSSTWISSVRWGQHRAMIANGTPSELGLPFVYDQKADPQSGRGHEKSRLMCAYDAAIVGRTMRQIANDQREALGADPGMFIHRGKKR